MADGLLLDTCAVIWLSQDAPIAETAVEAILATRSGGAGIFVSVMTAWELGMLMSKGRVASTKHPLRWFEEFVDAAGVTVLEVSAAVLVAASYLPMPVHNDPMDRIMIATAREHDLVILTRDRAILAYGEAGHVRTHAC